MYTLNSRLRAVKSLQQETFSLRLWPSSSTISRSRTSTFGKGCSPCTEPLNCSTSSMRFLTSIISFWISARTAASISVLSLLSASISSTAFRMSPIFPATIVWKMSTFVWGIVFPLWKEVNKGEGKDDFSTAHKFIYPNRRQCAGTWKNPKRKPSIRTRRK